LEEFAYLYGEGDVDTTIKGVTSPGGTVTVGMGATSVTSRSNGIHVSIKAVTNLKLYVYYLKHMEIVQRNLVLSANELELARSYHDQHRHEVGFKNTAEELEINDKDWHRTVENIKEYLAFQYEGKGDTLDYVVRPDIAVTPEAQDPSADYDTVDQEMTIRAPHTGRTFVNDIRKVWAIMPNICGKYYCFVYIKPEMHTKNIRDANMLMFGHLCGPNNVGNMASATDIKLNGTLYNRENKRFIWKTYVWIRTGHHSVMDGLKDYGYTGIYDSLKAHRLLKGIKTMELDVCKTQFMLIPTFRDDFAATVEFYSTFIKQLEAHNP
jgi:hypothetical protein